MITFSVMQEFHEIIADSFDNSEVTALRRLIVDWYLSEVWEGSASVNSQFARIWQTGSFDVLEARCEEFVRGSP